MDKEVPSDDFAFLMYFLDCICICVPGAVPEEYRNYNAHDQLDAEQKIDIVRLVNSLWLILSGNHIVQEKKTLDGRQCEFRPTNGNSFLQLSGKQINVVHTLFASHRWLYEYFTRPLRDQMWRLETDEFETRKQGMELCRSARAKWDEARVVPEHSGYFQKKGGFVPNWKSRWFAVSDQYLFYAKDNDKETNPQGVINLRGSFVNQLDATTFSITALASASQDGKHDNSCRTFFMRGDRELVKSWMLVLQHKLAELKEFHKADVKGLPVVDEIF